MMIASAGVAEPSQSAITVSGSASRSLRGIVCSFRRGGRLWARADRSVNLAAPLAFIQAWPYCQATDRCHAQRSAVRAWDGRPVRRGVRGSRYLSCGSLILAPSKPWAGVDGPVGQLAFVAVISCPLCPARIGRPEKPARTRQDADHWDK